MPPGKKIPAEAGISESGRRYRNGAIPSTATRLQNVKLPVSEAERPAPTVA